jgi:cephalosporin hydroxylase
MEHYYKEVPSGWFNYEAIYQKAIERVEENTPAHFVELGVWFGQSMCFAGIEIINSGKNIKLDGIDCFLQGDQPKPENLFDEIRYSEAKRYTEPVKSVVNLVVGDTHEIKDQYEDESLDFVYIDANHSYDGVIKDLQDWYPKIKKGGMISGHDYEERPWPGLVKAVDEFFGKENIEIDPRSWSWIYYKK